jgi:hypothetical protein
MSRDDDAMEKVEETDRFRRRLRRIHLPVIESRIRRARTLNTFGEPLPLQRLDAYVYARGKRSEKARLIKLPEVRHASHQRVGGIGAGRVAEDQK